ncbi:MAG: serine/threonine-protein kinase [Polyangiales bacterium]
MSTSVDRPGGGGEGVSGPTTFASGRYVVERKLGAGGQKSVFLVRDVTLDRECALSRLDASALTAADAARLRTEARALARMGAHPHVVTVYDFGEEAGVAYLVCEYVRGGDLAAAIANASGSLSVGRAVTLARQILRALDAVHARGIVHRDLKPANVWLAEDGTAKLGDFGLALTADRSRATERGVVLGTPSYMAPEQLRGDDVDGRADLYAFGCLLYEMLTGRPPYLGPVVAVISQHLHADATPPSALNPDVPASLDRFVADLLKKDPDARPASAARCLVDLDAIARELGLESAPVARVPASAPHVAPTRAETEATAAVPVARGVQAMRELSVAALPQPDASIPVPVRTAPRGRTLAAVAAALVALAALAGLVASKRSASPALTASHLAATQPALTERGRRLAVIAVREGADMVDGPFAWALASRLIEEVDRYREFRPVSPAGLLAARLSLFGDAVTVPDEGRAPEFARRVGADTVAALSVASASDGGLTVAVHVFAADDPARGVTGMRQHLRREDLDADGAARVAQATMRALARQWNVARWTDDQPDASATPMPFDAWRAFLDAEQHCMLGRYERCEAMAREGLARDPDNALLHSQLACALSYPGQSDAALAEVRRSMALRGRLSSRRDMLVVDQSALWIDAELARARHDDDAVRRLALRMVALDRELHETYGDPVGYLYEAAVTQYFLNDVPRARTIYAAARRASPSLYPGWYEEAVLVLGDGTWEDGRRDAARLLWTFIRCHATPEIAVVARADAARLHLAEAERETPCR